MKNSFINLLLIILLLCSGCSFNKYIMLIGEIPAILKVELDSLESNKFNYVFTSSSMNSNYMYKLIANDTSLYFNDKKVEIKKTIKRAKDPILLLDDVLLELDDIKRAKFLNELTSYCQAFYTFLPRESYFNEKKESIIEYNVCEGCLNEI